MTEPGARGRRGRWLLSHLDCTPEQPARLAAAADSPVVGGGGATGLGRDLIGRERTFTHGMRLSAAANVRIRPSGPS
jgi:hypothetical protein